MKAYRIKDWNKLYETHDTRKLRRMTWVPIPNKHDGEGYRTIIEHEKGAEIFAAWILILQVASKCEPRGELINRGNVPITSLAMQKKTGIPADCFELAFKVLEEINWIEIFESPGIAGDSGRLAGTNGMEGKGREGTGSNTEKTIPAAPGFLEKVITRNFKNQKLTRLLDELKALPSLKTEVHEDEERTYCAIWILCGIKPMRERYPDFNIYKFINQALSNFTPMAIAGAIDGMLAPQKDPDSAVAYWQSLLKNNNALRKTWEENIWPEMKNGKLKLHADAPALED
jgi:hypothetical protein